MTLSAEEDRVQVDTDVFSYVLRGDPQADYFRQHLVNRTVAVSFMTVAELYYGAYKARWGARRIASLELALKNYVILPYDSAVSQAWARVRASTETKGITVPTADAWHAACAIVHSCSLATNNVRHFKDIDGLTVIAPGLQT